MSYLRLVREGDPVAAVVGVDKSAIGRAKIRIGRRFRGPSTFSSRHAGRHEFVMPEPSDDLETLQNNLIQRGVPPTSVLEPWPPVRVLLLRAAWRVLNQPITRSTP